MPLESYISKQLVIFFQGDGCSFGKESNDTEYVETAPMKEDVDFLQLLVGDSKQHLPDPPIIFRYNECI